MGASDGANSGDDASICSTSMADSMLVRKDFIPLKVFFLLLFSLLLLISTSSSF